MARVLVVDNAAFMRSALKYILETGGHKVIGLAANGEDAVRQFKELRPDIVTLDIVMEGMDGMQALDAIMKIDPEARVVMVSAIGNDEKIEEARRLGSSGYIRKPFNNSDIMDLIEGVMKGEKADAGQKK